MAKDNFTYDGTSAEVMGLSDAALPDYLLAKIQTRSLSRVVVQLNNDCLFGSADVRDMAQSALKKLGFVDT